MEIKILGTGCPNCKKLFDNVINAKDSIDSKIKVKKVEDMVEIIKSGVMSLPGLMIDDIVVSYGKILSVKEIEELINNKK